MVHSYRFVSKESALKDLMARNGLAEVTDGLAGNLPPDAFIVSPKDTEPEALERLQKELSGLPMVETSQFDAGWAPSCTACSPWPPVDHPAGGGLGIALVLGQLQHHPPANSGPAQ